MGKYPLYLLTRNISKMTKPEHVKYKTVNKLKSHAVTNVTVTVISVSQISTEIRLIM